MEKKGNGINGNNKKKTPLKILWSAMTKKGITFVAKLCTSSQISSTDEHEHGKKYFRTMKRTPTKWIINEYLDDDDGGNFF